MAMSILPKFLTLKWNISRTIWPIEVGDDSFFCIFHALSFVLNFFRPEVPFKAVGSRSQNYPDEHKIDGHVTFTTDVSINFQSILREKSAWT